MNTIRIRLGHEYLDVTLAYLNGKDAEKKRRNRRSPLATWTELMWDFIVVWSKGSLELRFGLRLSRHWAGPRPEPSDRLDGLGTQLLQQSGDRSKAKGRPG
jgi:hypothetical protein